MCVGVSLMFVLYNLLIFCFFFSLFQVQAIYKSLKESIDRKPDSLKKKKTLKRKKNKLKNKTKKKLKQ